MAIIEGKHYWDNEEIEVVSKCREKGLTFSQISKIMSKEFGREYTRAEISSVNRRYLKTGLRPSYPGEGSCNKKPLGSERKAHREYIRVKISDTEWDFKHRVEYMKYHGEIPEGYVVIFANGNKKDFSKENLIAIDRNKLKIMNRFNLIKEDIEATKTGTIIADIIIKTQELKKNL